MRTGKADDATAGPSSPLRSGRDDTSEVLEERGEVVDGGGFAGDAVVVHGVDAVGGDVHLEEVAVAGTEGVDAFDGDAAEGEVVGELPIVTGEWADSGGASL